MLPEPSSGCARPDLAAHHEQTARWPIFAAAAAERTPVEALFPLPLQWGAVDLGVLDPYRGARGGLSAAQRRDVVARRLVFTEEMD